MAETNNTAQGFGKVEPTPRYRLFEICDDELAPRYRFGEWLLGDCDAAPGQDDDVVWIYPDGSQNVVLSGSPSPNRRDVLIGYVVTASLARRPA